METIRFAVMIDVTQLPRIRRVADWLDDQKATRDVRKLQEKYAPLTAEAEKQKNLDERDRLLSEWSIESDLVLHPSMDAKASASPRRREAVSPNFLRFPDSAHGPTTVSVSARSVDMGEQES